MRRLEILVAGPHPPPSGGIATVVRSILGMDFGGRIRTRLFDVRNYPRPSGDLFRLANSLSARVPPRGERALAQRWLLRHFRRELERSPPDVVHVHASHGYGFWSGSRLVQAAREHGARTILHSHGSSMDVFYETLSPAAQARFRRCLDRPDLCITLSRGWRSWFSQFVPDERLALVPNCIDWKRFQAGNPGRRADPPTILFAGVMFAHRKGLRDLVAVAPRILDRHPGARFLLVGGDDEGFEAALSVDDRTRAALHFTGDLPAEELIQIYAESTVFVLPSYHEGMPMTMLESMASGLPVVCTSVNAIPEVVRDGGNGFLIRPGDRDALADRILRLLEDPNLRERMGEAARAHIEAHHSLARQQEWLGEIYEKLARRERAPAQ
jgi:glycosyltransferase involved in cell wall biosynthesis